VFRAITLPHVSLDFTKANHIGEEIVGISTIIIMLLSITGLYFYFPMLKRSFFKNMKLDIKSKGYGFWYKLHSITGVYTFIFVILMSLSGLYFAYDWFKQGFHFLIGDNTAAYEIKEEKKNFPKPNDISEILRAFQIAIDNMPKDNSFLFLIPDKTNNPYSAAYKKRDYIGYGGGDSIHIDMDNNKTTYHKHSDEPLKNRILNISQLHYGTYFGETGKALWSISSLSMALFGISGIMMFYRRRKRKIKKEKE
jgi:sulfite reductase (NADPH) flavoprotein alpha-component